MAVDKLVDSTLLDAACTYEAGKIREKLGSSAQISYDLANGKGFGDAIEAIETGGGGVSGIDPFPLPDGYSLPLNYQKLLYVDSSSAQICDTGVHPTLETKIEVVGYYIPGTYGAYVSMTGCNNPTITIYQNTYNSARTYFSFGDKLDFANIMCVSGGIPLFSISKTEARIQNPPLPDQSRTCGATTMSGNADTTIGIFGRYNGRTVERQSPIRFFRERIWENDTLIRCIFPVLKDGEEICLYDVINGIYMPNLGTDPLVGGLTL